MRYPPPIVTIVDLRRTLVDPRRTQFFSDLLAEDIIGRSVNSKYRITGHIDSGATANVYQASDAKGNDVAIKMSHTPAHNKFLESEGRHLGSLDHGNIVRILDDGVFEDRAYLVLEYLHGNNLAIHPIASGMSWEQSMDIFLQICDALSTVHNAGLVHRDIKTTNIFVSIDGSGREIAKLLDFGLAKQAGPNPEKCGIIVGTPMYMAPEQGTGSDVDHRADIYALGITMYEVLSGRLPFRARTPLELVNMHLKAEIPPLQAREGSMKVPSWVEKAIRRALEKVPGDRFASVSDMKVAISTASGDSN